MASAVSTARAAKSGSSEWTASAHAVVSRSVAVWTSDSRSATARVALSRSTFRRLISAWSADTSPSREARPAWWPSSKASARTGASGSGSGERVSSGSSRAFDEAAVSSARGTNAGGSTGAGGGPSSAAKACARRSTPRRTRGAAVVI